MRRVVRTLLLSALLLAGCGKSNFRTAVIVKPAHPIYDRIGCQSYPDATRCSFDLRRLLGLKLLQAENWAHENGLRVRVVERDQEGLDISMSFDGNRVDVATESGIVTEIRGIG